MHPLKRLLIILCTLFINMCFAQNNLILSSANGKVFKVLEKGKAFNTIPQAHVVIEKIMKDTLYAELEFENRKKYPVTIYLLEQGLSSKNKEYNYQVECNDVNLNLRFTGVFDILPFPNPLVPAKPIIDTSRKYRNQTFGRLCQLKEGKPLYFNNIPKDGICLTTMPAEYMNYTALLISKAEVQDHKYTIVENVCRNNCLSVDQLGVLLKHIEYEIEKLKIVRLAYYSLVDPANKKNLEKAFRFEPSINELNAFLKTAEENRIKTSNGCSTAASQMLIDKYALRLSSFGNDAERFEAFRKGYADLCYSADHAILILSKFIHDREKLDAAKLLYFNCVEKDKFLKVAEVFSYNQTSSELKDFIDKQRQ